MASGLTAEPLGSGYGFNWVFLVEILVCSILAVFFLFYFNRLFATLVSYCIRAYTWHAFRAYIDITSLQISLLGGRVFFKSIRYHAHNVTCLVHEGHITWRYWLRQVQDAEVFEEEDPGRSGKARSSSFKSEKSGGHDQNEQARSRSVGKAETGGARPKKELPCRFSIKVSGVEAFVYNRSPSYDLVQESTLKHTHASDASGSDARPDYDPDSPPSSSDDPDKKHRFPFFREKTKESVNTDSRSIGPDTSHTNEQKPPVPAFLRLFPVRVECRQAAATLGNENTTNVIIAKVNRATGTIDAGHAGPLDLFKLLFNFDMEKCNATMRPNQDFKQLQLAAAQRILSEEETDPTPEMGRISRFLLRLLAPWRKLAGGLGRATHSATRSVRALSSRSSRRGSAIDLDGAPTQPKWSGLDRYMDEAEAGKHDEWNDIEYAKASTLADIEKLHMKFYFDLPGTVPHGGGLNGNLQSSEYEDDINGSAPPDYGMDFAVYGGTVTYGPWADRQRLNIQQIFFPASYVDAIPPAPLKPGETRNWTIFKIFISIEEDVVLRIPSREPSKDEKWQGRAKKSTAADDQDKVVSRKGGKHGKRHKHARRRKGKQGNPGIDARPYAWLDVVVKTDTTVRYTMDMFPRSSGYRNTLDVDCKATEINTSVNHDLLWRTGAISVVADLAQPNEWNTLRKWPFDITINDMELFILRDHLFLIIDLVNDWSYGPPVEFYTFVPYFYSMHLLFRNFTMYLNVNDANIVNNPADLTRNDFLTLEGVLDSTLDINMDQYRPVRNMITFDVLASDLRMRMLSATRTTMSSLLHDKVVAELPKLTLYGSYSGHLEERPGLVDTLRFDIVGSGLTLKAYGYLVRQLINIKENYFGDYMHFKTLEEFQEADDDLAVANIKTASIPKPSFINELDVMLCIVAEDVTLLLPTNIYSANEFVRIELPVANLDLRIVSYYLDMGLQLSPVTFFADSTTSSSGEDSPVETSSQTQLFIKHVNLDGHRSFGLPPDEPAYISQWDVDVGAISGELHGAFVHDLAMGARAFVFGFQDCENALPIPPPTIFYEATFVQVRTDILRLWFHAGKEAFLFSADPVEVTTNDWASDSFSQRISVLAPKITVACVDARGSARHRAAEKPRTSGRATVKTYAFFQTGAAINVVLRKAHFELETRKQQAYIRENDRRTNRAPFLLRGEVLDGIPNDNPEFYPPTSPYPFMPPPLDSAGQATRRPSSIKSIPSLRSLNAVRAKASSSSLSASIRTGMQSASNGMRGHASDFPSSRGSMRSSSPASSLRSSIHKERDDTAAHSQGHINLGPSRIAFSSSFAEPYFPLDMLKPDESDVPGYEQVPESDDTTSDDGMLDEAIDYPHDHSAARTSVLVQLKPGIRAYFEPRTVVAAAKIFRKILPKSPEEVMDAFQMDVLGAVAAKQREQGSGENSTLEIQAALPTARIRAVNPGPTSDTNDQLDLNLRSIDALVRVRDLPMSDVKETLAVHATSKSVSASFGRPEHLSTVGPAVQASIDDALVWVAAAAARSIHATIEDTVFAISGERAESLVDFVLRVVPLITELKTKVAAPLELNRNRLLLLVHTLTQRNEDLGEPAYFSRVTYILRAFPNHVRNQESWKLLARLRHILRDLPADTLKELTVKLKKAELDFAPDAPAKALDTWAQWQNWDVPNVHQTVAFQMFFGDEEEQVLHTTVEKPLLLTVRSDYLRLAVEADKLANEIVIRETSLGVESTPPTAPTGLMLVDENTRTKVIVQMHSSSIAFLANWSAFSIAQRVLAFKDKLQQLPLPTPKVETASKSQRFEDELNRTIFQIVVSTDSGSISVESINLRHVSRADGLKISLIGATQVVEEGYGPCATGIINADTAVTELFAGSRPLWRTNITSPSIYADHLRPDATVNVPPSTYIAVGSKGLELRLLEQVPGLLQIVDSVILDEVTQVLELMRSAGAVASPTLDKAQPAVTATLAETSSPPVKLHVALLGGDLRVEVSLLQAITYQMVGTGTSVRLAPSLSEDRKWAIDFDIGRQNHRFINPKASKKFEQSILDVPPANGHIGLQLAPDVTTLSVGATMERVDVNAAAIQGVVATLNHPGVQDVLKAVKSGVDAIKQHVVDIFPPRDNPQPKPAASQKKFAYEVRFALLGIRVAAVTPRSKRSTTEVEFGIGTLHTIASNKQYFPDNKIYLPEVRAQVKEIGAKLQIHEGTYTHPCGRLTLGINMHFKSSIDKNGRLVRTLRVQSDSLEVYVYPETASTAVDVINHMQDRLRRLDLSKEMEYIRRLGDARRHSVVQKIKGKQIANEEGELSFSAADLLSVSTTVQLNNIKLSWIVNQSYAASPSARISDLVLSLAGIEFTTRGGHEARLAITDLQLSLVKHNSALVKRALNSALLPEVTFSVGYWSTGDNRSLTFKAAGKPLELRLESKFLVPVNALSKSINFAIENFRSGTATWKTVAPASAAPSVGQLFDVKRLGSLLFEADFAGALFYVQGSGTSNQNLATMAASSHQRGSQHGRYGQFAAEGTELQATLKAPGIAMKFEYNAGTKVRQPTLNGEIRIDASSNLLLPNVVPLLLEISHSVSSVVKTQGEQMPPGGAAPTPTTNPAQKLLEDDSIIVADPAVLFGKMKLDIGFRVCRQEFGLTCQPIARVDAKAELDDFYFTVNTIESDEHGHFFAITAVATKLSAQVKHVYSREPTFTFDMESMVLSVMNSKHLSGEPGISAILKLHPTRTFINGKQLQDLLLFREIWLPPEIRAAGNTTQSSAARQDEFFVQKYRAAAAAAAFPWNATISIAQLAVDVDLGQSIGKSSFSITNLWATQTKSSSFEQNLCIGMDEMAMNSTGRMSGFIRLSKLGVRTSITWPQNAAAHQTTPLIQASVGFNRLLTKAAFDYQSFAFGDIEGFDFLMYNVHQAHSSARDRLVAVLDCDKAYIFCTATSPARAVGLYQAFDRLIQEKQTAFENSLRDIEKHIRRESTIVPTRFGPSIPNTPVIAKSEKKGTISLHTDVVLTIGTISFGVYPGTFFDNQILKLEANAIQARFAAGLEQGKVASALGMTLGQLSFGLASVKRINAVPKALDISVDEVITTATNARGGTILRVPKVIASMQTWQAPHSNNVDYIFKSLFDGKIDVGWNLSRIDYIRGMWTTHTRALAARLGKALPASAVKITAEKVKEGIDGATEGNKTEGGHQEKITAEVNLPLSHYDYHALVPPIIETPQLRDMGEATPPLEWIGLHRDRLPNVTHQIVIVSLLEVVREVEDAYRSILGSS
ncbi:hypothetical protein BDY17DRAFT_304283 [Neohortaea acidophila]|uniref:Uncharacterized protein n=1 Tax=Neohortaea acidophila TaxID=245834 RepID=A0A6A6PHZ1_9PEZI|nr:uncharacterized protein BDY17DRAFT_304283 [Neohortaea acidophila]KAF2479612.1 hypothetical protein BDY17DRAFT_304283 [Neohortaea acidophila]